MSKTRVAADERLDHLYMKSMRCPYCRTKMPKGTSKCANCGITKEQMYYAEAAHWREHGDVIYTKVRPYQIAWWEMVVCGIFGFLGVHCFRCKRYWRGLLILGLNLAFIVCMIIFHPAYGEVEAHAWRNLFEPYFLFPTDLLGIVGMTLWIWDLFAIILGHFKYRVVLPPETESAA